MAPPTHIADAAFQSDAWRSATDALYEATGLVIGVSDAEAKFFLHATTSCTYCDLISGGSAESMTCLAEAPDLSSGETIRTKCRGGLPCYVTPIVGLDSEHCCTLIVGGFVSSTRDRKRIFERLQSRGTDVAQARAVTRAIPILTQREVEALSRMAAINAREAVRNLTASAGVASDGHEDRVFAEAGREFAGLAQAEGDLNGAVIEKAMRAVDAEWGALMLRRSKAGVLDVVATRGDGEYRAGQRIGSGHGVAGRVAATGRSAMIMGSAEAETELPDGAMLCVPLVHHDELVGVLSVGVRGRRRFSTEQTSLLERFAAMLAGILSDAAQWKTATRTIHKQSTLSSYSKSLAGISGVDEAVSVTCAAIEDSFDFDAAGLAILGWGRDEVSVIVDGDVPSNALDHVLEQAVGRDVVAEPFGRVTHVVRSGGICGPIDDPDLWSTMSVEVMMRDTLVGYIFLAGHRSGMFDGGDRELLMSMAEYVAAALEKASLFARLRDDYAKTIAALGAALDLGERREFGHSDRVMDYAVAIGSQLGLAQEDIETLRFAGLLHDVGKDGLTEEILLKPSRLSRIEMEKMRRHADFGAGIVEQIHFLDALAPVVMHHHERWDGQGHPVGLKGTDIPLLARVLAVADGYDALTSSREHQPEMSKREARTKLQAEAGKQYDPRIVAALFDAVDAQARAGATGLLSEAHSPQDQLPS